MRSFALTTSLLASSLLYTAHAQLIIPFIHEAAPTPSPHLDLANQQPMAPPAIQLPDTNNNPNSQPKPHPSPLPSTSILLSDVLNTQRPINTFAGFTRDFESISERLDDTQQNTTILAPANSAIAALPRKPWEDPREYASFGTEAYEGDDGVARARRNLQRFTEAHLVPASPWEQGERVKTLAGSTVWWERDAEGVVRIHPGGVVVRSAADRVANGEVWVLEECLNYAQ